MESTQIQAFEKIEAHELEDLKLKWGALHNVKEAMAEHFVTEQRLIADKPRLIFEFNKSEAEYKEANQKLATKYGNNISSVDLQTGVITYK